MNENGPHPTLFFLKTMFPGFEDQLDRIYGQDPVFREIAGELLECIQKQELICKETGKASILYTDTISELKDELLGYLQNMTSGRPDPDQDRINHL